MRLVDKLKIVGGIVLRRAASVFKELGSDQKRQALFLVLTYFLILFGYPFVRATTTAFYIQSHGAKATPIVWFLSVIALSLAISAFNQLQKNMTPQRVFALVSAISVIIFGSGAFFIGEKYPGLSTVLYIWKEVYIVLLVHLSLAFANNLFSRDQAKVLFGPLGAVGSLGGIIGGLLTSKLSSLYGLPISLVVTSIGLILTIFLFLKTHPIEVVLEKKKQSPIRSIGEHKKYIALICVVIACSQFVINIANLEFNLLFEKAVPDQTQKASYLGMMYSTINAVSLFIQVLILPYLLTQFDFKKIHYAVVGIYFFTAVFGLGMGSHLMVAVGSSFVMFKAVDYSLFSTAKEFFYYPLSSIQKYGAKYLSDMITYRSAKALISLVLIGFQDTVKLNAVLVFFLIVWILTLILMERYRPGELEHKEIENV